MNDILQEARTLLPQMIDWRRDFHRHPELAFEETRTAGIAAEHLRALGFSVRTNIGRTGVIGIVEGTGKGPTVLMRFDMDALPIQEENECDYRSLVPGKMHACGHDGHVAMGMGVASLLANHREDFPGRAMLIFQPAEEIGKGAEAMIADGALEDPVPDYIFSVHVGSQEQAGVLTIGGGPILSAADKFRCVVHGSGGHGAEPHKTVDAVIIACQIVNLLQTIVSRNVGPLDTAVLSIGSIHAGEAFNVIPEKAVILGNIRTYLKETQQLVHRMVRDIVMGTAEMMGGSADIEIVEAVPAAVNDPAVTEVVYDLAEKLVGRENIIRDQRSTPSDDIAFFLQAAPGCYFGLGAGLNPSFPHHNPRFNWDEEQMPLGVALLCETALYFLQNE